MTSDLLSKNKIFIGKPFGDFENYIPIITKNKGNAVIVTDANVFNLYIKNSSFHKKYPIIVLKPGEKTKSLKTVNKIYDKLLKFGVGRDWYLIGIGGGVICDIVGYVASTYLRGLKFGFVPTTLLAQVDAAIGGKNGVNFHRYKNMIGTFNQPEFVICDLDTLFTLSKKEINNGFAEIIKYSLVKDSGLLEILQNDKSDGSIIDIISLSSIIEKCIKIKLEIVQEDEKDNNIRKLLNLGHTFGHALEKTKKISHGIAVCIGIKMALEISVLYKYLSVFEYCKIYAKILTIFDVYKISTNIVYKNRKKIIQAIQKDKKRKGDIIDFILYDGNKKEAFIKEMKISKFESILKKLL